MTTATKIAAEARADIAATNATLAAKGGTSNRPVESVVAKPAEGGASTLTTMQRAVLLAFPGGASAEGDNGASWTEVADLATATGLTKRQVMGVLSSLSAKGLIYADEEKANGEAGTLQCLTDEGARLVGTLTAEPVQGGVETAHDGAIEIVGAETVTEVPVVLEIAPIPAPAPVSERKGRKAPAAATEPAAPTTWDACKTAEDVTAVAATQGMKLVPQDTAALVAGFPGVHKNLRSFATYHFVRFPKSTPQEGAFIALTAKHGAIVVRDGKVEGPTAGKSIPVMALFKAERA